MKKYIALCILLIAVTVYAIPPSPPYILPSSITAEITGNVSGSSGNADKLDNHDSTYFQTANATLDTLAGITYQSFMTSWFGSVNVADALTALGLGAANDVQFGTISGTYNGTVPAANVSGLRTDNSTTGYMLWNNGGNIDNVGLTSAFALVTGNLTFYPANAGIDVTHVANALSFNGSTTSDHVALIGATNTITDGGTIASLNVRDVASVTFADSATALTVSSGKTGFVVPAALNGKSVAAMTCRVIDQNGANANVTTINLDKNSAGNISTVFDTAASIGNADYYASAASPNATNAAVATGDLLIPNVTAIADPAPKGLVCSITTQ